MRNGTVLDRCCSSGVRVGNVVGCSLASVIRSACVVLIATTPDTPLAGQQRSLRRDIHRPLFRQKDRARFVAERSKDATQLPRFSGFRQFHHRMQMNSNLPSSPSKRRLVNVALGHQSSAKQAEYLPVDFSHRCAPTRRATGGIVVMRSSRVRTAYLPATGQGLHQEDRRVGGQSADRPR